MVKSLFKQPLELKVGNLQVFPEAMRSFDRRVHDGIILDDVRDLAFVAEQQEKLQAKYEARFSSQLLLEGLVHTASTSSRFP